jgi:4-hydroxybenzoate polyprenyltransferase
VAGLFGYSAALKRRFLVGHAAVAALGALVLPFGGLAAGSLMPVATAPVAFLAFFAREVLKTVPDLDGDRAHGVDNVATRFGPARAVALSRATLVLCALLVPLLPLAWRVGPWYYVAVALLVWPTVGYSVVLLARPVGDDDDRRVRSALRLVKLVFLLYAVAVLLGALSAA